MSLRITGSTFWIQKNMKRASRQNRMIVHIEHQVTINQSSQNLLSSSLMRSFVYRGQQQLHNPMTSLSNERIGFMTRPVISRLFLSLGKLQNQTHFNKSPGYLITDSY